MKISLSDRVNQVKPSPTLAVTAMAAELRASGQDVIGLGAGEPDFDTPDHIKQAAITAINSGFTKYTPVDGTASLKQAIMDKFSRDNQLKYEANQILVSSGGKQSFYNLCQALLNPGDEVIIPAPYWVSYPDMALLANGVPVFVNTDISQSYKMTAEQLDSAITDKSRLLVINSPSNPTGAIYSREELAEIGSVIAKHPNIVIACDDMYEHILLGDMPFTNLLNAAPDLYERTVVMNGVSKAYSMTGWRIGYAAGAKELIAAMKKVQSQSTSNPCSISQVAAEAALNGSQEFISTMLKAFKKRHNFVLEQMQNLSTINCISSQGAFYSFIDVSQAISELENINNDVEFANYLLNEVGVAVVPGSAFGVENSMRISFATSMENLKAALGRITSVLS